MTQQEAVEAAAEMHEEGRRYIGTAHVAEALGGSQEEAAVVMLRAWRAGRLARTSARSRSGRRCYAYWVTEKGYQWLDWLRGPADA